VNRQQTDKRRRVQTRQKQQTRQHYVGAVNTKVPTAKARDVGARRKNQVGQWTRKVCWWTSGGCIKYKTNPNSSNAATEHATDESFHPTPMCVASFGFYRVIHAPGAFRHCYSTMSRLVRTSEFADGRTDGAETTLYGVSTRRYFIDVRSVTCNTGTFDLHSLLAAGGWSMRCESHHLRPRLTALCRLLHHSVAAYSSIWYMRKCCNIWHELLSEANLGSGDVLIKQ